MSSARPARVIDWLLGEDNPSVRYLTFTRLGVRDPRMQEALDLVASKQDANNRWLLEDSFNGRFLVPVETRGRPSKWVTLNALTVLRAAGVR